MPLGTQNTLYFLISNCSNASNFLTKDIFSFIVDCKINSKANK